MKYLYYIINKCNNQNLCIGLMRGFICWLFMLVCNDRAFSAP